MKNVANLAFSCGVALFLLMFLVADVSAQETSQRPSRTDETVEVLKQSNWVELDEGLSLLKAETALGTEISAFKINPSKFSFSIVQQNLPEGERASEVRKRLNAYLVVNGGFFSLKPNNRLLPVGQLIIDGNSYSKAWSNDGGYLAIVNNTDDEKQITVSGFPVIVPTSQATPDLWKNAVQSKPVLIEPGGKWAMNSNDQDLEPRTVLCELSKDQFLLVVISGRGLSLFETGWVLRGREWGGYFDCDSALALDGGGSTQLSVKSNRDLNVEGQTPVNNLLVITQRSAEQIPAEPTPSK